MTREDERRPSTRPPVTPVVASAGTAAPASVIHVDFARREVRRDSSPPPPAAPLASEPDEAPSDAPQPLDPVARTFGEDDVVKLLGFSLRRLRALDRSQVVSPSGLEGGRRVYRFPDLIALRAARDLLAAGHTLASVTAMVARLNKLLESV